MQAVGRLGSYISRSVYTVSAPFHPFGGAVDIIVVEQPDGTYKSSPWYVRFGKFQGVLKTKEKVVSISVNGVDADFNMYLDHKGEAFFLKEVDEEGLESACSPPSSSGEDTERQPRDRPLKPISYNCDADCSNSIGNGRIPLTKTNSSRSHILGIAFGRKSTKEEGNKEAENASCVVRTESLERAEMAADLLDLRWSTNLASPRSKKENASRLSAVDVQENGVNENLKAGFSSCDETGLISHSSYPGSVEEIKCVTSKYIIETATSVERVREDSISSNMETLVTDEIGLTKSDYHVNAVSIVSEVARSDSETLEFVEKLCLSDLSKGENAADNIRPSCYSETSEISGKDDQSSFIHEEGMSTSVGTTNDSSESIVTQTLVISEEEQLLFGNLDGVGPTGANLLELGHAYHEKEADCSVSSEVANGAIENSNAKSDSVFSLDQSIINDYLDEDNLQGRGLRPISSEACINEISHDHSNGLTRMVRSLPDMGHLSNNLEASELGHSSNPSLYIGVNSGTNNNHESHGVQTMTSDVKILKMSEEGPANPAIGNPPRPIDSVRGSRRSWFPFKRSRSMKVSQVENGSENSNVIEIPNKTSDSERGKDFTKLEVKKKIVKTLLPTPEQLASLNLKEGKNIVIFTFSTAMLGKQQVDARIFRWRWDSRIVISDVDGTITRSDLLGQVMPLVGMDWSHTGVAHLFSAIKENGYQLIFLSARSISQSFITRQFLFNIKQDGKALPEGPVVISPDGLFPSLFREVVRRAPHEFKIACLEDIKALFPADTNPFYAGFGNRDTDELSYLKVGIPKGKIFIINPKGEIAVNRRVDTKSYLSLHALVHGMFPTMSMSSSEQEAFNSWNYWKLPPPVADL